MRGCLLAFHLILISPVIHCKMAFFHNSVATEFQSVNKLILNSLQSDVGLVENIGSYIVDSGGKRLRPVLVLLSALANNYQSEKKQSYKTRSGY